MTPADGAESTPTRIRDRKTARIERNRRIARVLGVATLIGVVALALYLLGGEDEHPAEGAIAATPGKVTLVSDRQVVARISPKRAARIGEDQGAAPLAPRRSVERGNSIRVFAIEEVSLRRRLAGAEAGELVSVPERVVSARVETPLVQQIYRNNCETAALSMLLGSAGIEVDQRRLQDRIATAEPLDPKTNDDGEMIWGDPNGGFVGRPPGGGPAGGFGVFEPPVLELASRWADPVDLTGRSAEAVYRRLRAGRAVMTWIGLSDGPYETWLSPEGTEITVNFGEHTVVLTGIEGDRLSVNDPLDGMRKTWTKQEFEAKWALLEQRAISI